MTNFNSLRVFEKNSKETASDGAYVLYWMQVSRRFHYNYALEHAVEYANKLGKPLLILEALSCDYPWANDRIHRFILEGMSEHYEYATRKKLNYVAFSEWKPGEYERLLMKLASSAAVLITDEYPLFPVRNRNETLSQKVKIPYISVDSNGLIPLGLTDKDPYSAYLFRKIVQKKFIDAYTSPPASNPLDRLKNRSEILLDDLSSGSLSRPEKVFENIPGFIEGLAIDHSVKPVDWHGGRSAGLDMLGKFLQNGLQVYDEKRNDPDEQKTSRLSPWLHLGKVSEYEIVRAVLEHQPEGWHLDMITDNNGSTGKFFNGNPNIDSFLDEVITWRETGFHFAHHRPDYDRFGSLPDWALQTLNKHRDDPRKWVYSYEELATSQTHDELWNAAQTQLREEGMIHNYLRMLWGKKVIEWTPDPETALQYLIDLNNTYAIDGRDPNSYSGIFWCFGRFDRAWQERDIFGKVRYMSSDSTRRKVKLNNYLGQFGNRVQSR